MNWATLFDMQQKLDQYIEENNSVVEKDLFEQKVLALIVELGELANETRSFKFWSKNKKLNDEAILEEYVDGIHFILSLGLEKGFTFDKQLETNEDVSLNSQFLKLYELIITFKNSPNQKSYDDLFLNYLLLGRLLHISDEQLKKAYFDKNEVNFNRQKEGY